MRKYPLLLLFVVLLPFFVVARSPKLSSFEAHAFAFRENKGQIRDQQGSPRQDIDFVLQTPQMTLYIGKGQLHYQFVQKTANSTLPAKHFQVAPESIQISRIDVELKGANPQARILKEQPQESKYHYYTNGTAQGIPNVSAYGKITYKDVYPSIDWVLYTVNKQLKYDFIVHPGGKVADIQLNYSGEESMKLLADGQLQITGSLGSLIEDAPYMYVQESKQKVSGSYVLNKNEVGFSTDTYQGTLVIDPGVTWATYYGGEGVEEFSGVAADVEGNVYVTGATNSLNNMATSGAHQSVFSGAATDGYLAKFDSTGTLLWATYYGGTASTGFYHVTMGTSVAVNSFNQVYLSGVTSVETGIATTGTYQPIWSSSAFMQGFLAQFNDNGIRQWGTYYSASVANPAFFVNATWVFGMAADQLGNVYIGGQTDSLSSTSGSLVTSDAHQPTYGGGENDGLLVKFDSTGNRVWATYFGGTGIDAIYTITCDDSNDVYVAGSTNSTNGITTVGTHEEVYDNKVEGFVTKFNGDGERLWGSYIRGGWAGGIGLATDPFNHLYLCSTAAIGAPDSFIFTENCHQATTSIGSENAFLIQFNSENGTRNWGTYYGAESRSDGLSVAADTLGNVYFSGTTNSFAPITTEGIATDGSYQDTLCAPAGTVSPPDDAFVVLFDSTGKRKWASYFGGPDTETGEIAYAPDGTLYLAGMTASSTGIATPNVYQSALSGDGDVFIVRWLPNDINLQAILSPVNDTVCAGAHPFSVQVKNQGRMNKVDDLVISYNFTGPENGSGTFSFSDDLNVGAVDTFSLDDLTFAFPGEYNLTVYLHYTKDDQDKDNDTLQMVITATNAVPVSEIEVNQVGTVMHFSNPSAQASDIFWWDFGDGNTSTEPSPSHQYAITGLYQITLVTSSFCGSDTATLEITGEGNSIEETYLEKNILIYPNPTKHMLYLKLSEGIDISSYRIINILGQEVMAGRLDSDYRINVSGLPSGSYFIQVQSQRGLLRQKFQVLH